MSTFHAFLVYLVTTWWSCSTNMTYGELSPSSFQICDDSLPTFSVDRETDHHISKPGSRALCPRQITSTFQLMMLLLQPCWQLSQLHPRSWMLSWFGLPAYWEWLKVRCLPRESGPTSHQGIWGKGLPISDHKAIQPQVAMHFHREQCPPIPLVSNFHG